MDYNTFEILDLAINHDIQKMRQCQGQMIQVLDPLLVDILKANLKHSRNPD